MNGSPAYQIVRRMIERGNKPGLIRELLEMSLRWSEANGGQDADALRGWLPMVNTAKPFYTAAELAALWPALKFAMGFDKRLMPAPSANLLANTLKHNRLPLVRHADQVGDWFYWNGRKTEFFICERIGYWRDRALSQKEIEEILHG